jgi:hypothetical protein
MGRNRQVELRILGQPAIVEDLIELHETEVGRQGSEQRERVVSAA